MRRHHAHYDTRGGGHLYQGRYKSFPVQEDRHFLLVCRYVDSTIPAPNRIVMSPFRTPRISRVGKPIVASLGLRNGTDAPIGYWQTDPLFTVEVRDATGRPVAETEVGGRELGGPEFDFKALPAGATLKAEYDLTRWFVLREEGFQLIQSPPARRAPPA